MSSEEKILTILEKQGAQLDVLTTTQNQMIVTQNQMIATQTQMLDEIKEVKHGQSRLEIEVAAVKERVQGISESVAVIEIEHGKRLGALEDGQCMLIDYAKETKDAVKEINGKLESHELNIKWIDSRVRKTAV